MKIAKSWFRWNTWPNWLNYWWSSVVVSALASINEVNLRRARLVLRWATVSVFNSRCRTFISVRNNQPPKANSAFHPSGVGKWVPASAGKAKAGMVHSVCGWTRGVQVKLRDNLERVPYLSALQVCWWQGAIHIHVYLTPRHSEYIRVHAPALVSTQLCLMPLLPTSSNWIWNWIPLSSPNFLFQIFFSGGPWPPCFSAAVRCPL